MTSILVVGEDLPCCTLGERLVQACLPRWKMTLPAINTNGVTKLQKALPRYLEQARFHQPVLCIADTDGDCPATLLRTWLPHGADPRLLVRLAVTEAESWALADATTFADVFAVPIGKIPRRPDEVADPKASVLALARRSRKRVICDEVVSAIDPSKPGTGYNLHLCSFIKRSWRAHEAARHSPSLHRAMMRLQALAV